MRTEHRGFGLILLTRICALALAPCAFAQHAGDILLRSNSGAVQTGLSDGVATTFPHAVFAGQFGKEGLPNRTSDPGINSIPGDFPTNAQVQLRMRRAARKWDPIDQNFCMIPPEMIEVRKGTNAANWIRTPASDPPGLVGPTISMGVTDPSDGLIHQHPAYWLLGAASDGVYLLELDVLTAGLSPSAPIWLVFDQNATAQEMLDALAYADGTLAHGSGNLCRCRADMNDDLSVSVGDLFLFLADWFAQNAQSGPGLSADIDHSGDVSVNDLFVFLGLWFTPC